MGPVRGERLAIETAMTANGTERQFAQCKDMSGVGGKADLPVEHPAFSDLTQFRHKTLGPSLTFA